PSSSQLQPHLGRHTRPYLLPYTTLFRSVGLWTSKDVRSFTNDLFRFISGHLGKCPVYIYYFWILFFQRPTIGDHNGIIGMGYHRSEEHTSELQSRENLVCRVLLENNNSD